jgi:hypothetical protein
MLFDSLKELKQRLDIYAGRHGFKVRQDNHDDKKNSILKGAFVCWCYKSPQQKSSGSLGRSYHGDIGRVNCSCTWSVRYKTSALDCQFHITTITKEHSGHSTSEPPSPSPTGRLSARGPRHLRAREDVSNEMVDKMRELVAWSQPSRAYAQLHMSGLFSVTFDDDVFRHIYRAVVSEVTYQPTAEDWRNAVRWGRSLGSDAMVAVDMDSATGQGRRLLFMSPSMTYNFRRNSEVIVMDTTHGTNRYRYHLLLLVGVSQYGHSVIMAAALLRNQQQDDFIWAFNQIRDFVGPAVWDAVKTITSDGDGAMKVAITACLPRVFHMRCVWHIQRNINDKCTMRVGGWVDRDEKSIQTFMAAANKILFASSEAEAQTALQQLYLSYPAPACRLYFDTIIMPNLPMVAAFALRKKVTFGMQSTQRSESIHALIKRDNKAYKPLTITTTALELVTILYNVALRHKEVAVQTDTRAKKEAQQLPVYHGPAANSRPDKSLHTDVIRILTAYATNFIAEHFQAISNYNLETIDAEDDGIEEWRCSYRDRPDKPQHIVTVKTLLAEEGETV